MPKSNRRSGQARHSHRHGNNAVAGAPVELAPAPPACATLQPEQTCAALNGREELRWSTTEGNGAAGIHACAKTMEQIPDQPPSPTFVNPVQPQLSGDGVHVGVLLRGLPNELCTETMMMVVLDQAGLKPYYIDCRCEQGDPCGEAFFSLTTLDSAEYAVWHFEGCHWGNVPCPVTARLVEVASGQLSYEDEMDYNFVCGYQTQASGNLIETVLSVLSEPSEFGGMHWKESIHRVAPPLFLPMPQPAMLCDIPRPEVSAGGAESSGASGAKPLWERCSDQVTAEASTDAGTSEISDDHDGDEGSD